MRTDCLHNNRHTLKPTFNFLPERLKAGFSRILLLLATIAAGSILASCGTDSHHFKLDGRLLNLNQGEFYVYSTDGMVNGLDTIHVRAGRFSYVKECQSEGTLVIVFPNFSEQPVFATPGKAVELKGDATHLKELKVTGTEANKLMNSFREHIANMSPAETKKYAAQFIKDNPQSIVSNYLVDRYFLNTQMPDYKQGAQLLKVLRKAQPENGRLAQMEAQISALAKNDVGQKLQAFTAKDVNGRDVKLADIKKGDALIYVWASWDYESCALQRSLRDRKGMTDMKLIGISVDASPKECQRVLERDEIDWSIICDGQTFNGKLINQLGLAFMPDNILLKDGKVVERNLTNQQIRDKIKPNS